MTRCLWARTGKVPPQWKGYEAQLEPLGVQIVYLSHTDGISSTQLTEVIKGLLDDRPEKED